MIFPWHYHVILESKRRPREWVFASACAAAADRNEGGIRDGTWQFDERRCAAHALADADFGTDRRRDEALGRHAADEAGDSGKGGPERGHRGQGDQAPSRVWLDRGRGAMARVRLAGREFLQDARMRPRVSRTWYNPLNTAADAGIDARGDHVRRRDARGRRSAKPVFFGRFWGETLGHGPKPNVSVSGPIGMPWFSDRTCATEYSEKFRDRSECHGSPTGVSSRGADHLFRDRSECHGSPTRVGA